MELIGSTGQKQGEIAPNEGNSAPHTPKKNCASQTVSKLGILKCCTLHPHGSSYINQRLPLDAEIQGHPRPPKATEGHPSAPSYCSCVSPCWTSSRWSWSNIGRNLAIGSRNLVVIISLSPSPSREIGRRHLRFFRTLFWLHINVGYVWGGAESFMFVGLTWFNMV